MRISTLSMMLLLTSSVAVADDLSPSTLRDEAAKAEQNAAALQRTNKPFAVKFGNSNATPESEKKRAAALYAEAEKQEKLAAETTNSRATTGRAQLKSE